MSQQRCSHHGIACDITQRHPIRDFAARLFAQLTDAANDLACNSAITQVGGNLRGNCDNDAVLCARRKALCCLRRQQHFIRFQHDLAFRRTQRDCLLAQHRLCNAPHFSSGQRQQRVLNPFYLLAKLFPKLRQVRTQRVVNQLRSFFCQPHLFDV